MVPQTKMQLCKKSILVVAIFFKQIFFYTDTNSSKYVLMNFIFMLPCNVAFSRPQYELYHNVELYKFLTMF